MEELLSNFSQHLKKNVSQKIGEEVQNYVNKVYDSPYQDENDIIEHEVKTILTKYFKKCNDADFMKISQNLYNCFIDNDDNNLINSVKVFISFYSKFEEIKMKRLFCRWRINILYENRKNENKIIEKKNKNLVIENKIKNLNNGNKNETENLFYEVDNSSNKGNKTNKNININTNYTGNVGSSNKNTNNCKDEKIDIFNRLYMNAFKKQDDKLLNDEIKKISEMDECTFKPNIIKKKN